MMALWYSNAPWTGTGYGQQTDVFTRLMVEHGHNVAIAANYGLAGAKIDWHGITVYPGGYDVWANDVVPLHARDWMRGEPGWVITLCDVWVLKGPAWREMNVASWVPVDHQPTPPKVVDYFTTTKAVPIAMSKWGQERLLRSGLDEVLYCPHGIDTDTFKPVADVGGIPVRQLFGIPDDAFVVGMNAANKGSHKIRKSFPQAFTAFALFRQKRPDAVLYVHAEKFGHSAGVDLVRLAESCGVPREALIFTDQYAYRLGLPPHIVAAMYSAFDVLLSPSMGEGFGIPVIEAQACGVPVIVSDFSAQPELVGSGWTVGGVADWDEHQAAWLHLPDVIEIAAALEDAYDGHGDATKAREFALGYDHHTVYDAYWAPILGELERRTSLPTVEASPVNLEAL